MFLRIEHREILSREHHASFFVPQLQVVGIRSGAAGALGQQHSDAGQQFELSVDTGSGSPTTPQDNRDCFLG